jgi:hypothetical protein
MASAQTTVATDRDHRDTIGGKRNRTDRPASSNPGRVTA